MSKRDIFIKAHSMTKELKMIDSKIDYRTALSINLKEIYKSLKAEKPTELNIEKVTEFCVNVLKEYKNEAMEKDMAKAKGEVEETFKTYFGSAKSYYGTMKRDSKGFVLNISKKAHRGEILFQLVDTVAHELAHIGLWHHKESHTLVNTLYRNILKLYFNDKQLNRII